MRIKTSDRFVKLTHHEQQMNSQQGKSVPSVATKRSGSERSNSFSRRNENNSGSGVNLNSESGLQFRDDNNLKKKTYLDRVVVVPSLVERRKQQQLQRNTRMDQNSVADRDEEIGDRDPAAKIGRAHV